MIYQAEPRPRYFHNALLFLTLVNCLLAGFLYYSTPIKSKLEIQLVQNFAGFFLSRDQTQELKILTLDRPLTFVMTFALACYFGLIWTVGSAWASVLFAMGMVAIVWFQCCLLFIAGLSLNLGDLLFFCSSSLVLGGVWRLSLDGQLLINRAVRVQNDEEWGRTQAWLFKNFADGFSRLNEEIRHVVDPSSSNECLGTDEEQKEVIEQIIETSSELRDYLVGINQYIGQTADRAGPLAKNDFNLKMMLERVIEQVETLSRSKLIEIELICKEEVFVDSVEMFLELTVYNVLVNAIKFSRQGGSIIVRVAPLEQHKSGQAFLNIEVIDFGAGIPQEDLPHVFEKFYSGSNPSQGTGLGLYLCRFFIRRIGGEILIFSKRDEGTQVRIVVGPYVEK